MNLQKSSLFLSFFVFKKKCSRDNKDGGRADRPLPPFLFGYYYVNNLLKPFKDYYTFFFVTLSWSTRMPIAINWINAVIPTYPARATNVHKMRWGIAFAIALKGSAKVVKRVSRNLFYPRPHVDSAVVKIEFERGRVAVKDERAYRQTVKCAFLNRRKTLENNLVNFFKLTREQAKAALAEAGVDEKARGENLSPQRLAKLSDVLLDSGAIKL